ncbi:LOW QUALITY PROTEIN: uncharacterized protein AB9W97_014671 [Spinachia spinachia]
MPNRFPTFILNHSQLTPAPADELLILNAVECGRRCPRVLLEDVVFLSTQKASGFRLSFLPGGSTHEVKSPLDLLKNVSDEPQSDLSELHEEAEEAEEEEALPYRDGEKDYWWHGGEPDRRHETRRSSAHRESDAARRVSGEDGEVEGAGDPVMSEDAEPRRQPNTKESVIGGMEQATDKVADAGRRLQGARDVLQKVSVWDVTAVLSQCVAVVSDELHRLRLRPQPQRRDLPGNRVAPRDAFGPAAIPGIAVWPEGSVSSRRDARPEVFRQRLVQLPPALSRLHSLPRREMLGTLASLSPAAPVGDLAAVFWLQTAGVQQPLPNPACLLMSEKDIVVLSSGTKSDDPVVLRHRCRLLEIEEVQVGLAGQHVRLIGRSGDAVLVVLTPSKELTPFCRALLTLLSSPRGAEDSPLLSGDLMVLSLDWRCSVPDVVLDSGLRLTSRFKRVLADLLYIVHGNMGGPGDPSLAHVRPLLYSSVTVKSAAEKERRQDGVVQFLLTDTHVALLREDAVFHPPPRGSALVPARPQFQALDLRRRSDIGRLFVRTSDDCLAVVIAFAAREPRAPAKGAESRRRSADAASVAGGAPRDLWTVTFGCTAEAATLIEHLSA